MAPRTKKTIENDTKVNETVTVNTKKECKQFTYVGPYIKKYGLISNMTYIGTRNEVEKYLKAAIDEVPEISKLLVPVLELSAKQKLLKERNNSFYNLYQSVKNLNL